MQTVNFQCGHCGKLMAVGVEFLGQQVRCPHCQQVVLAPATAAAVPEPQPVPELFANLDRHEDIFATRSETDDPLFGQDDAPKLEFPLELDPIAAISFNGDETVAPPASNGPPQPPDPALGSAPAVLFTNEMTEPAVTSSEPTTQVESAPRAESPTLTSARARRERKGIGGLAFLLMVFLPTLLWALGASAMCYWLYAQLTNVNRTSPFDQLPDDGDDRGIKPKKRQVGRLNVDRAFATRPLPTHLKVKLGETIRVGDLEVTPTRVARGKVAVMMEGYPRHEPCSHESLVLYLKLKNVADDYAFAPLDNYFDRQSRGIGQVPLTVLQAGRQAYFGGPAKWVPLLRPVEEKKVREWVKGRKNTDRVGLQPGEETESFVCTDGDDARAAEYLFGRRPYKGELLWRVHVRRGAIEHKGKRVSATAVVGVMFTDRDYKD
jgi:hypothetical protein